LKAVKGLAVTGVIECSAVRVTDEGSARSSPRPTGPTSVTVRPVVARAVTTRVIGRPHRFMAMGNVGRGCSVWGRGHGDR
jgi:hypothetical protein